MKKQYIIPKTVAVGITPLYMVAASPGVSAAGDTVDISSPESGGNASEAASARFDLWDACENEEW